MRKVMERLTSISGRANHDLNCYKKNLNYAFKFFINILVTYFILIIDNFPNSMVGVILGDQQNKRCQTKQHSVVNWMNLEMIWHVKSHLFYTHLVFSQDGYIKWAFTIDSLLIIISCWIQNKNWFCNFWDYLIRIKLWGKQFVSQCTRNVAKKCLKKSIWFFLNHDFFNPGNKYNLII